MKEAILDTKFVGEIKGEFFVPSYQRGYRWSDEVRMLVDDIYKNGDNSYCLQPIVVKYNDGRYELIDGQQRLTTIYLIYQYASIIGYEKPPIFPWFAINNKGFIITCKDTSVDVNIPFLKRFANFFNFCFYPLLNRRKHHPTALG